MSSRDLFLASVLVLGACDGGSGKSHGDLAVSPDLAGDDLAGPYDLAFGDGSVVLPTGSNVVPLIVDDGPAGLQYGSANVGFVTLQICAPGTTTCATIDHVSVDTGSVGLRILSSAIPANVLSALPITQDTSGRSVGECYNYADGYVWGSVRTGDLTMGAEKASSMPFHVMGDHSIGNVPAKCPEDSSETEEDTLDSFGSNAIIGIGPYAPDCGDYCTTVPQDTTGWMYWGCTGGTCTAIGLPISAQPPNPVSAFATDNNGVILTLPDPGDGPVATLTGALTFGIGTQANNTLKSSATVFKIAGIDSNDYGDISGGTIAGKDCGGAFFDSGTSFVSFDDSALTQCTGDDTGFFCPAMTTPVAASNTDGNGTTHPFTYHVGNADTLFNDAAETDAVFKAVVSPGGGTGCDWGLGFFYGKAMYVGIEGTTVTGATTPFEAY